MLGFKVLNRDNHIIGESIGRVVGLIGVSAEYIRLGLAESETKLELISYRNPTGRPLHSNNANDLGLRHLALRVSDIEQIYSKLQLAGIEFFSTVHKYGKNKKLCYFHGPEGIILELAQYN
jgi:catechol 2,3-dioxygenase-like lactoylglutathione lyase family enzyme